MPFTNDESIHGKKHRVNLDNTQSYLKNHTNKTSNILTYYKAILRDVLVVTFDHRPVKYIAYVYIEQKY